MPQAGFNIPSVTYQGINPVAPALQQFEKLVAQGSGKTSGLSQLMQLMRLKNMMDMQRMGRTKKEREEYAKREAMGMASQSLLNDAEYLQGFADVQNLSAQKAIDRLSELKKGVISRYAKQFNIDPSALYEDAFGGLDQETRKRLADVKAGKSFLGEVGTGLGEFWDAARYAWETDPAKRQQIVKEAVDAEEKRIQSNAYLQDQQRREAEGEGFLERSRGDTGSFLANVGRGIGAMLPQLGIQLGARAGGAALGGAVGAAGGPIGATGGALAGAIFGGAVPGAAQASYDFARRVMADPNLTDEQKQVALESGQWQATALGGALGAIPIGARDVARAVAPRVGQALGRGEAQELARRAAVQEAERGWFGNIPRNVGWSAGELSAMMGGGVAGQNIIYGAATGQDIPVTQGMEEALAQGLVLAPLLGAATARPRYTRAQVAGWKAEDIGRYQQNIRAQIANNNFGGEATTSLVKQFRSAYSRPDDLTQLLTGFDSEQRAVIRKAYGAAPERVVQSTTGTALERQLAAQGITPDEAGAAPVRKETATTRSGRIQQVADAFAARTDSPEVWEQVRSQSPTIATHIEKVSARLDELGAEVKDFYNRLRKEPTAVKSTEIAHWLANQPDTAAFIAARDNLRSVLEDAVRGKSGDTANRIFSYDKIDGADYIKRELLSTLKAFKGGKGYGIENARILARDKYKWSGQIKDTGAEDATVTERPVEQPAARPEEPAPEVLGADVSARAATDTGTPSRTDSTVEAAAEALATKAPSEPVQPSTGGGEPVEGGRLGGAKTSNVGESETLVSTPEQARVEPQQPGTDGGRSVEPTAPIAPEADKVAGEPTSEASRGKNGARIKTDVSAEPTRTGIEDEFRVKTPKEMTPQEKYEALEFFTQPDTRRKVLNAINESWKRTGEKVRPEELDEWLPDVLATVYEQRLRLREGKKLGNADKQLFDAFNKYLPEFNNDYFNAEFMDYVSEWRAKNNFANDVSAFTDMVDSAMNPHTVDEQIPLAENPYTNNSCTKTGA